jgi:hypothetical protein
LARQKPVDLVDHNDVDLAGPDVSQQSLQRQPLGRAGGSRFTSKAALATEAQDYRGGEAVALGIADASGHALEAFESFVKAMNGKK